MRVLIVEDDALMAEELAYAVSVHGHEVVGLASDRAAALESFRRNRPDAAFVDLHLTDGPSGAAVAADLTAQGVRVALLTGHPDLVGASLPWPVLTKPYFDRHVRDLLDELARAGGESPARAGLS